MVETKQHKQIKQPNKSSDVYADMATSGGFKYLAIGYSKTMRFYTLHWDALIHSKEAI